MADTRSYAPEVLVDGTWCGNSLRFATREEARANVSNLMGRWFVPTDSRVVESGDAVNYRWVDGKGLVAADSDAEPRMPPDRVTL
jgi:hypothetical protein